MKHAKSACMLFLLLFCSTVWCGHVQAAHVLTPVEEAGKSIFFDRALSIKKNQSCATCHDPNAGWTGPDIKINRHGAVYNGSVTERFGERKPPSAAYAAASPVLHYDRKVEQFIGGNFWDGRATGEKLGNPAADQAQGPFLNLAEQALPDAACVVHGVCNSDYASTFDKAFPGECKITWPEDADISNRCASGKTIILSDKQRASIDSMFNSIALAVTAYEASAEVNPYSSKYDYFLKGMAELSKEEKQGLELFNNKGKCSKCHISDGTKPLFTDFTYDNLGVPKNPENPVYKASPDFIDKGLGGYLEKLDSPADWQKFAQKNMGKHKVPTVRNIDKRPDAAFVKAYMHNGYFKTLKGVVHFYNTRDKKPVCPGPYTEERAIAEGCWPGVEVKENVNREELGDLKLTDQEEEAIVAFMKTLSDGFVPETKK